MPQIYAAEKVRQTPIILQTQIIQLGMEDVVSLRKCIRPRCMHLHKPTKCTFIQQLAGNTIKYHCTYTGPTLLRLLEEQNRKGIWRIFALKTDKAASNTSLSRISRISSGRFVQLRTWSVCSFAQTDHLCIDICCVRTQMCTPMTFAHCWGDPWDVRPGGWTCFRFMEFAIIMNVATKALYFGHREHFNFYIWLGCMKYWDLTPGIVLSYK